MSSDSQFYGSYENYNHPFTPKDPFINRDARHLTRLSLLAGIGTLCFVLVQYVFSIILVFLDVNFNEMSLSLNAIFSILISIFGIFVPFEIIHRFYSPEDREKCYNLGAPVSKKSFLYALVIGTAGVYAGNYITGGFSGFVSSYDIVFSSYSVEAPGNIGEFLLTVLQAAIIPAIVEEVAMRGIVMAPLRKYGDRFAIVMSAIIFALMHSNMVQIPFAFVAGIILGYFAISTNSLWTAIAIHAANNLLSVISLCIEDNPSLYLIYTAGIVVMFVSAVYLVRKFVAEPHYSLGLTFAPKSEKRFLIASAGVFLFMSFVYSAYPTDRSTPYILAALLFAFCVRRYLKANNKQMNRLPSSSLKLKMKVAIYCTTPSVVGSLLLLASATLDTITVTSHGGRMFLYVAVFSLVGAVVFMLRKVLKSTVIESKSTHRKTMYVLMAVAVFALLSTAVSTLLTF